MEKRPAEFATMTDGMLPGPGLSLLVLLHSVITVTGLVSAPCQVRARLNYSLRISLIEVHNS